MIALSDEDQIKIIQLTLGTEPDGVWGPKSQSALDDITSVADDEDRHDTYASSFADPADVRSFKLCKAQGKTDKECFKVGDNGMGCWGDDTTEGSGSSCALPPEYMKEKWGTIAKAKHQNVMVERKSNQKRVTCILKDRMPSLDNLANKAKIDLNPDACREFGLEPPIMEPVYWWWLV